MPKLSRIIGTLPLDVINVSGKRSITPATALRLQRFFGTEAEFWLNLQAMYDLEEERTRLAETLEAIKPCELVAACVHEI